VEVSHDDRDGGERSEGSPTPAEAGSGSVSRDGPTLLDASTGVLSESTFSMGASLIFLGPALLGYGLRSHFPVTGVDPGRNSAASCSSQILWKFDGWCSGAREALVVCPS
jgi:hypothetical protein